MAQEKAIDKDQETIIPAGTEKDQLSEEELQRASGGAGEKPVESLFDKTSTIIYDKPKPQ